MASFLYKTYQVEVDKITNLPTLSEKEASLINEFSINSIYDQKKHKIELYIYSLDNVLIEVDRNYTRGSQLVNAAGAGKEGSSTLTLDPVQDAIEYGFDTGDVRLLYSFSNNAFSDLRTGGELFIESISPDRTEFRALSNTLTNAQIADYVTKLRTKLDTLSYFSGFRVNFGDETPLLGLNIGLETIAKGQAAVFKLYKPLPEQFTENSTFLVEEIVADSVAFEIFAEPVIEEVKLPRLKGPNFNIELVEDNYNPTEYLDYTELFSYPVTSSYYELMSLFNESSAQISIDHTDFSSFIHFSSAAERLKNFKYKLDLISTYEQNILDIQNMSITGSNKTGKISYYENLITGIINNFDHYDRYLYYESGSYAWPKANSERPYINQSSSTTEASNWFIERVEAADSFDIANSNILIGTIPAYIRDDENNEPYIMFIHMIGHHFDNLWIYFKAVSDKYNADNRLNFGISKDLVRDAIESLGIKLYNSNQNLNNLFSMFTGESYVSGSELISQYIVATSGSANDYLQPMPVDNYLKEVYKRIYHNIPLLVKRKGTERGLRALINCFGIPSDILVIKQFGGKLRTDERYTAGSAFTTSSLDKVKTDVTGSLVEGNTLSRYTSIIKRDPNRSDDLHTLEVGFGLSELTDKFIQAKLSSSFNIDNYIGDPLLRYEDSYEELNLLGESITDLLADDDNPDYVYARSPYAFIRLIKFFDNSLFRIIRDFIPARSNLDTGVVVRSHLLRRSKAKQVEATSFEKIHTGSIEICSIIGSDGGSFHESTTAHSASLLTPTGRIDRNITNETPKYNGELSGSTLRASTGELNDENIFKKPYDIPFRQTLTLFNLSLEIPPSCLLLLESEYIGQSLEFGIVTGTTGTISIGYPTSIPATSSTFKYINNFDTYERVTVTAAPSGNFLGWYSDIGGTLPIAGATSPTLHIYYPLGGPAPLSGYYAKFSI